MRYVPGFIGAAVLGSILALIQAPFWAVLVTSVVYVSVALPLTMLLNRREA